MGYFPSSRVRAIKEKFGYLLGSARAGSNPAGVELFFSPLLSFSGFAWRLLLTAFPEKQKGHIKTREMKRKKERDGGGGGYGKAKKKKKGGFVLC